MTTRINVHCACFHSSTSQQDSEGHVPCVATPHCEEAAPCSTSGMPKRPQSPPNASSAAAFNAYGIDLRNQDKDHKTASVKGISNEENIGACFLMIRAPQFLANVDTKDRYAALYYAVMNQKTALASALLRDDGIDPYQRFKGICWHSMYRSQHLTLEMIPPEIARFLRDKSGIDITRSNPFGFAIVKGKANTAKAFLEQEEIDLHTRRPLRHAIERRKPDAVRESFDDGEVDNDRRMLAVDDFYFSARQLSKPM